MSGKILNRVLKKKFIVAVSGGPDSLALSYLAKIYSIKKSLDVKYFIVDHKLRKNSSQESKKVSLLLKKFDIKVASGEQVPSPVIFKQLLQHGAIGYCQIDATRLGGVNDVLAVILLAKKFKVPVCPHGGGIGLCNMILHLSLIHI